jgi:hypothetical protein
VWLKREEDIFMSFSKIDNIQQVLGFQIVVRTNEQKEKSFEKQRIQSINTNIQSEDQDIDFGEAYADGVVQTDILSVVFEDDEC